LTGQLNADAIVASGRLGLSMSSEALSATAQLIDKSIRVESLGVFVSQYLNEKWLLRGDYHHKVYSDRNQADDILLQSQYSLLLYKPVQLDVGCRFRFQNFRRQSGDGYFDPFGYFSYEPLLNLSFEQGPFYASVEPSAGYQSFERNHKFTANLFGQGNSTIGIKLNRRLSLELYMEGGNYALGTPTGFSYYLMAPHLAFLF
jgi:hypothetical protein